MPPVLAIVSPEEWLDRTSVTFGRRGPLLVAADRAYANYYRTHSEADGRALFQALHAYLISKNNNWENAPRDKNSGGLMSYIYKSCKPFQVANVLERRVPESRHGVIYLWQKASVETQWIKIALEGALGVGKGAFNMLQASSYQPDDELASLGVIGTDSSLNRLGPGLTVAKVAAKKLVGPKGAAPGNAPMITEPHTPFFRLADLSDDPSVYERAKHWLKDKFNYVYELISTKIKELWEKFQLQWASGHLWGHIGGGAAKLVNFVLGKIVAHAAPFAGSGIEIAQGLAKAFAAGIDRVSAAYKRSKFIVSPGHPSMIAASIERQMSWDAGKGLYEMAKGGVKLTGEIFSLGASALINLVAACVEFVYKICSRLHESHKMNAWLAQMKAATANRNRWKADPVDGKWRPALVFDDRQFRHLFQEGCDASVCIPMMTLNSGIAGDLMMFMKIFDDTGSILGQSTGESLHGPSAAAQRKFDAGHAYFSQLKEKGRQYLESTGFTFRSADKVAQGLMNHAIKHHTSIASTSERVLAFMAGSS